mmetsp:Transcript_71076/g.179394  ORF Transcript_71076/g.179394 Transcript_71076/m.179394 type:complete len:215 (-) Transcript_71076:2371-3015(-)
MDKLLGCGTSGAEGPGGGGEDVANSGASEGLVLLAAPPAAELEAAPTAADEATAGLLPPALPPMTCADDAEEAMAPPACVPVGRALADEEEAAEGGTPAGAVLPAAPAAAEEADAEAAEEAGRAVPAEPAPPPPPRACRWSRSLLCPAFPDVAELPGSGSAGTGAGAGVILWLCKISRMRALSSSAKLSVFMTAWKWLGSVMYRSERLRSLLHE